MSSTKKKIYIAIIVLCVLGSAAMIWYGQQTPAVPAGSQPIIAAPVQSSGFSQTGERSYAPPSVFPNDSSFDSGVLEGSKFKSLQQTPGLTVSPGELGRANPFGGF